MTSCDIAIVGFGFAGGMTVTHAVRQATQPLNIVVFDPSENAGKGPAYATKRPEHLLNVRTKNMGAFAENPAHFYEWCVAGGYPFAPQSFAPRMVYGKYLEQIFSETDALAAKKNITITHVRESVVDVDAALTLRTDAGREVQAKQLVFASGFAFRKRFGEHVVTAPWQFDFERLRGASGTVVLIGTGLTAVDTMMSLLQVGFVGEIVCVSRHGKFPLVHTDATTAAFSLPDVRPSKLLAHIRAKTKDAPWQAVMDGLRADTPAAWQRLKPHDQQRVLMRYFTWWNIHRHRMAPEIFEAMKHARVRVVKDTCIGADEKIVRTKMQEIPCIHAFDCTGPSYFTLPPCVQTLVGAGVVRTHESGVGLVADADGRVSQDKPIYALGSLLLGQHLETTAVPELRGQAERVGLAIARN